MEKKKVPTTVGLQRVVNNCYPAFYLLNKKIQRFIYSMLSKVIVECPMQNLNKSSGIKP